MAIHSTSNSKNNDIAASKPTDKVTKLEKKSSSFTLEDHLSFDLITEQTTLRDQRAGKNSRGLLILVNGMENSGKGEAVKALTEWMDARYIKVHATMGQHPSRYQPIWQRYTWQLPRKGEIAVYSTLR